MADNPMPPVVPQLTTPVPQRTDPENFSVRMDLTLFELPLVIDGINAASVYVQGAKMDVASMEGIRDETYAARDDAKAVVVAAASAASATEWVAGQNYEKGEVAWSSINKQTYRRLRTGSGDTDPALDSTNWTQISTSLASIHASALLF